MDSLKLQEELDNLTAWRKKELSIAYSLADNETNEDIKAYLCRAWVLIMYAHCDNFLKESAKLFINYLEANNCPNYKAEIIWLIIMGKENATDASENNYKKNNYSLPAAKDDFFKAIRSEYVFNKRSFKFKTLRFFCDWVLQIKYDYNAYNVFCSTFIKKRDEIAHGEKSYVNDINV